MGSYRSEDEALIGLARQLADAYGEARTREDQDFACDSIAAFLADARDAAPGEALLAFLDLPLTAETYPLVDEAQTTLAARGAEVVRLLLEAVIGDVYDPGGSTPERAAETLGLMDRREAVRGLVAVLCGHASGDVKGAALESLVDLGPVAEPALAAALDDQDGGEWAAAALEQIRYGSARPDALEQYAAGEGGVPDDAGALLEGRPRDRGDGDDAGDERPPSGDGSAADDAGPPADAATPGADPAIPSDGDPDRRRVDDAYSEFLRRFEEESGGETPPP